jgi:tetratricopeptide (TPR) repeat protein
LKEAQQLLENCLPIFKNANDSLNQGNTLSALAHIWKELGDLSQAIALERQSLAICDSLAYPEYRAVSHGNLSNYLHLEGQIEAATNHRLAQMIYYIVIGNHQRLFADECLGNLTFAIQQNPHHYFLPKLNNLLRIPEFEALRCFLQEFEVNLDEVQGKIDELLKR